MGLGPARSARMDASAVSCPSVRVNGSASRPASTSAAPVMLTASGLLPAALHGGAEAVRHCQSPKCHPRSSYAAHISSARPHAAAHALLLHMNKAPWPATSLDTSEHFYVGLSCSALQRRKG